MRHGRGARRQLTAEASSSVAQPRSWADLRGDGFRFRTLFAMRRRPAARSRSIRRRPVASPIRSVPRAITSTIAR